MEISSNVSELQAQQPVKLEQSNNLADTRSQPDFSQQPADRVEISSEAQQLLSATDNRNNSADLNSRQQAERVTQDIQAGFGANPDQAIATQANVNPDIAGAILG